VRVLDTRHQHAGGVDRRRVRDYYDAIAPHSERGAYVNFLAGDDQARIRESYGANHDRLLEVKRAYDPDNVFHLNQNIVP